MTNARPKSRRPGALKLRAQAGPKTDGKSAAKSAARPSAQSARKSPLGYSGTPLPKKLGIRPGARVALVSPPAGFGAELVPLPEHVEFPRGRAELDLALLFAASRAQLAKQFPVATKRIVEGGKLWIAWPKKTSGVATDLSEDLVRTFGLAQGWVDYKVCAINATWSGHAFARRKQPAR